MNHVTLIGRITKDPEIRYSTGGEPVAFGSYSIAIDRPTKDKKTDFVPCRVVGKTAEFAEKYLRKGMKIAVEGRVQIDQYKDKNGDNRTSMYVQVNSHEFCESKFTEQTPPPTPKENDGFMYIPDSADDFLPFN